MCVGHKYDAYRFPSVRWLLLVQSVDDGYVDVLRAQ